MEAGGRIAASNNDLHEKSRKKTKKKFGSLPLGVFLSFNDRGVHPKCPNASNSYHKCGRHCFDKIPPDGDSDRGKKFEKEGVNPNCANASNPYHKCAEYCFEKLQDQPAMKPKEEKKAGLTTDRVVKSECKFASNPYHVCDKHCLESVPTRDQPEQTMQLKSSREVKKAPRKKERTTGSPPPCKHKSIPHHECTEICLQSVPNRNFAEREKPNEDSVKSEKRNARLHRSASVPFHTVTEYCLDDTIEKEHPKRDDAKGVSTKADKNGERGSPEHASSSFHKVNEYFFEDTPKKNHYNGAIKPKEESDIVATVKSRVNVEGKSNNSHGSTTFVEQNVPSRKMKGVNLTIENPGGVSIAADNTSGLHKPEHLSSPFQKMTEYCGRDTTEKELSEGVVKLEEEIEMVRSFSEREHIEEVTTKAKKETKVFSSLPRMNSVSSNTYHKYAEICNDNVLEDQPGKTFMRPKDKETVNFPAEGAVNPDCQFASNRYHVCDGYCFQSVPEREKRQKDMKLNGLKELKKLFSNKKITREQPQCIFASNPYHKCAEYCLYGDMPNGAMKINERKKDDNYSSRRGVDLNHKQASKKNEETEVTFKEKKRDSLKDGMKSAESKHVDLLNPVYDKFDLKDITEDLHSAKVVQIKQLKELADVQLTDSSDILHEWSKYCSQKGADDIIGNIEGEVYLKDYASEKLKVQANGRLACSISTSLLYFLGFLFSAVYWIQMIHSFIMSPEKAKGGEGMKADGDEITNAEMRPIHTTSVRTAASEDQVNE